MRIYPLIDVSLCSHFFSRGHSDSTRLIFLYVVVRRPKSCISPSQSTCTQKQHVMRDGQLRKSSDKVEILANILNFLCQCCQEVLRYIHDTRIRFYDISVPTTECSQPSSSSPTNHPRSPPSWHPTRLSGRSSINSSAPSSSNFPATAPRTRNPQSPISAATNTMSLVSATDKHVH